METKQQLSLAFRSRTGRQAAPQPRQDSRYRNIMVDPRVIRGNTYSTPIPTLAEREAARVAAERVESKRRAAMERRMRRQREELYKQTIMRQERSAEVAVQTDDYLEELVEQTMTAEQGSQTLALQDEDAIPVIFIPEKKGISVGTQVEAGELFDFDQSVEPILQVLVGKTLDLARQEVLEEEELNALEQRRGEYESRRNALHAETERLANEAVRQENEKARRLQQEQERVRQEAEVNQKLVAAATSQSYVRGLSTRVLDRLEKAGHFVDPVSREVDGQFIPWLYQKVHDGLYEKKTAQHVVDSLIADSLVQIARDREAYFQKLAEEAEKERLRVLAEQEQARLAAEEAEKERLRVLAEKEAAEIEAAKTQEEDDEYYDDYQD